MFLLAGAFAFVGAVIASFAGVVAERIHTGEGWVTGRSRCNSCGTNLRPFDLVPVAAWVSSFGRARCCGSRIPWLYPVIEASTAALFVLAFFAISDLILLALFLLAISLLVFIVLYDLRHTLVPAGSSNLFLMVTLAYAWFAAPSLPAFGITLMVSGLIGLAFFLLYACSRGRAMGLGDSPVALGLSFLTGNAALAGLLFSFWIGGAIGIIILVTRPAGHRMGIEVPFVPFLAVGYLLAFFTQWNPLSLVLW